MSSDSTHRTAWGLILACAAMTCLVLLTSWRATADTTLVWEPGSRTVEDLKPSPWMERPYVADFRFRPGHWQTNIALPDAEQKTLVDQEGALLYDYPGRFAGFGTRVSLSLEGGEGFAQTQSLEDPRMPIVVSKQRAGDVALVMRAFTAPGVSLWPEPPGHALSSERTKPRGIERVDDGGHVTAWAHPAREAAPAFWTADVLHGGALCYRFKTDGASSYWVGLGFCEKEGIVSGQRNMELLVEGAPPEALDPAAKAGPNRAFVKLIEGADADGDGFLDIEVRPAPGSANREVFVNALWVFREKHRRDAILLGEVTQLADGYLPCGGGRDAEGAPHADLLLAEVRNEGGGQAVIRPVLTIESDARLEVDPAHKAVWAGRRALVGLPLPVCGERKEKRALHLSLGPLELAPGASQTFAIAVHLNADAVPWSWECGKAALESARRFWKELALPYSVLQAPDEGIQGLIESGIRNVYQAREMREGRPALIVGPTCYRDLWVVDTVFMAETLTMLNRVADARAGLDVLLGEQEPDGSFELIHENWKETGLVLWGLLRHAELTGDTAWLRERWDCIERAAEAILVLRQRAMGSPEALHAGLVPPGFTDGGIAGTRSEYSNVFWSIIGLRCAADMAGRLGESGCAVKWREEQADFDAAFRKAMARDLYLDDFQNRMLPVPMARPLDYAPHRGLWSFLIAAYPGGLFAPDDAVLAGTLNALAAHECEGLVRGTGWLEEGLWTYFASFHGNTLLWLGQGARAARGLYAFANHASPTLAWWEEQPPLGEDGPTCGDMPHGWAGAEFVRLAAHLLVFERGDELHLLEGLPPAWLAPGAVTRVNGLLTRFGEVSLSFEVNEDGGEAHLHLEPPHREPPERIVLHTRPWARAVSLRGKAMAAGEPWVITPEGAVEVRLELGQR